MAFPKCFNSDPDPTLHFDSDTDTEILLSKILVKQKIQIHFGNLSTPVNFYFSRYGTMVPDV